MSHDCELLQAWKEAAEEEDELRSVKLSDMTLTDILLFECVQHSRIAFEIRMGLWFGMGRE